MFDFLKFNKKTPAPKPQSVIVEKYVLIQPRKLLIDYSLFDDRKTIPVAYEQSTNTSWNKCVVLPNEKPIRIFLKHLRDAEPETVNSEKMRTISIVKIDNDKDLYIFPDLKGKKQYEMFVHFKKQDKYSWAHYVTPEINRAIVEQIKLHTR